VNKSKDLTVRFLADTKGFERGTKRVEKNAKSLGKTNKKVFDKANLSVNNLSGSLAGLVSSFRGVGIAIVAVGTAFAMISKKIIESGMEAETAITKLDVMMGKGKGLESYRKALEYSVVTPFDPKDIVKGTVVAGQYSADAFKKGLYGMKGTAIEVIADMASYSGQTMQEAATVLFRADLALMDKYGKQGRDAYKEAKKVGALGSTAFIEKFVLGMSKVPVWMGMANENAKTMAGIWSTIKGNAGLIFTYMSGVTEKGLSFWTRIKPAVKAFSDAFGKFVDDNKQVFVDIGVLFGYVWEALGAVGYIVLKLFQPVWELFKFLMPVFKIAGFVIKTVLKITAWFLMPVFKIAGFVIKTVLKITAWIVGSISDLIMKIVSVLYTITGLRAFFNWVSNWISGNITKIKIIFFTIVEWGKSIANSISNWVTKAFKNLYSMSGNLLKKLNPMNWFGNGKDETDKAAIKKVNRVQKGSSNQLSSNVSNINNINNNTTISNDNKQIKNNTVHKTASIGGFIQNPFDFTGQPDQQYRIAS